MELMILGAVIILGILLAVFLMIKAVIRKLKPKKVAPEPKQEVDAWVGMFKAASGNPEMEKALAELLKAHLKN